MLWQKTNKLQSELNDLQLKEIRMINVLNSSTIGKRTASAFQLLSHLNTLEYHDLSNPGAGEHPTASATNNTEHFWHAQSAYNLSKLSKNKATADKLGNNTECKKIIEPQILVDALRLTSTATQISRENTFAYLDLIQDLNINGVDLRCTQLACVLIGTMLRNHNNLTEDDLTRIGAFCNATLNTSHNNQQDNATSEVLGHLRTSHNNQQDNGISNDISEVLGHLRRQHNIVQHLARQQRIAKAQEYDRQDNESTNAQQIADDFVPSNQSEPNQKKLGLDNLKRLNQYNKIDPNNKKIPTSRGKNSAQKTQLTTDSI